MPNREPAGASPQLRIQLLGRFAISVDDRPVPETAWRQRRAAGVIKLLALEPSHRLHREQLMDLLWPDLDYSAQLNNLRQALHHARRGLELAGMPPGMALDRAGDIVVLAPSASLWVDVDTFEESVSAAWQVRSPAAAWDALSRYTGDLLPDDRYDEWAEQRRTTLRASYLALLARVAVLYDELGETAEAIETWQRLVTTDPTNEGAHIALMRLYATSGRRQQALQTFDQLVTQLECELDASPEPASWELAEAIRDGRFPDPANNPAAFQPPPARRSNLPAPISRLVGREQEQAELRLLLTTERLVTLTGPGGIGKTRLAIEIGRSLASAYPGGVVFIDLTQVREASQVVPAIASGLGIREIGGQSLATTIGSALQDQRVLLILDNVEQVVEAGQDIALLLEHVPSLKALVTSRVRLRIRGESEYAVPALAVERPDDQRTSPAVQLFVTRAQGVQPELSLTNENAKTITDICRRLDGLPLAIELAAARSRILSPRALLERLEHPLGLLIAGANDLPERQQTIRATIQWSYDLLDPAEQKLFARLSVFAGGWSLEAAEVVVPDDGAPIDVVDGLDSLAGKSLITQRMHPDGEIRFGMLTIIREFGLERLAETGDETRTRDRHAGWVVRLVEQAAEHIEGAEQVNWLARLERDSDNIRAGLDWLHECRNVEPALRVAKALRLHWFTRGRIREGLEQIIAITDLPESESFPALRADALTAASFLAREMGDYQQAYDITRTSLAISHQIHDRQRSADALVNLGFIALHRGQLDDARSILQRSLTTNHELNNDQGVADSLGFLALVDAQSGDLDTASRRLEQCITIWDRLDDLQGVAWANAQLGLVRLEQDDHARAWDALMTSLSLSASLDFRGDVYMVFDGLARLALSYGCTNLACSLATAAASVREQSGITPAPADQKRIDRLSTDLRESFGTEAIPDVWSRRHDWTLEQIMQSVTTALAPLIDGSSSTTPTVS